MEDLINTVEALASVLDSEYASKENRQDANYLLRKVLKKLDAAIEMENEE